VGRREPYQPQREEAALSTPGGGGSHINPCGEKAALSTPGGEGSPINPCGEEVTLPTPGVVAALSAPGGEDNPINPYGRGQPYQPPGDEGTQPTPGGGGSSITPVGRKQTYQPLFLLPEGRFKIANESYFKVTKTSRKERHIPPETFTGAVLKILGHLINRWRDYYGPLIVLPVGL
jgi:hypothetical protein